MSIRVITAVFDHSRARGTDRLVLLVIADRVNDEGDGCWRGKESIARMANVSRSTVTDALRRLEGLGELVVERRPGTTSSYRVVLPGVGRNPADPVEGGVGRDLADQSADGPADSRPNGQPRSVPDTSKDPGALSERVDAIAAGALETRDLARDLLRVWWEGYDPRPTQNYPGALAIVERAIRAGWTDGQVRVALAAVDPPLSGGKLEAALRRRHPSRVSATDPGALT